MILLEMADFCRWMKGLLSLPYQKAFFARERGELDFGDGGAVAREVALGRKQLGRKHCVALGHLLREG